MKNRLIFIFISSINICFAQSDKIPKYNEIKNLLPEVILEKDTQWIKLYNYSWKTAFNNIKAVQPLSSFVSNYIDEGFNPNIFQWDTEFMLEFWKYAHHIYPAILSNDNFYVKQHSDGFICRELSEKTGKDILFFGKKNAINPPLFSWSEYNYLLISVDTSRIRRVLPSLIKYADWLENNRVKQKSKHKLFWQKSFGSGMDNCPRKGNAWVDMSAQMCVLYDYISKISAIINDSINYNLFKIKYIQTAEKINHLMWNDNDGYYYDLKNDGRQINNVTIATFWTLFAGISNKEQAQKLVNHLIDTSLFWRNCPFPSIPANHKKFSKDGDYWKGSVWAPTNYMIIKSMQKYGYDSLAYIATERFLNVLTKVYNNTNTLWENYSSEFDKQGNRSKPEFVGWTGIVPITLLIENIIGISVNALNNTIYWNIQRNDKHGIKNLRIGINSVNLICSKNKLNKYIFQVETIEQMFIEIKINTNIFRYELKKGLNKFEI